MKQQNRWGRFAIHVDDIQIMPAVVSRLMAGMLIVRAEMHHCCRMIEYDADSLLFEPTPPHIVPPRYAVTVMNHRFFAAKYPRQMESLHSTNDQPSLWELFKGQTPILIESENDLSSVRVGLDMKLVHTGLTMQDADVFADECRRMLQTVTDPEEYNTAHVEKAIGRATEKMRGTQ